MKIYQLKISLLDVKPPVWVRLNVPAECSFATLHKTIIALSNWAGYHMYDFKFKKSNVEIKLPDESQAPDPMDWIKFKAEHGDAQAIEVLKTYAPPIIKRPTVKLFEFFEKDANCLYTYDYGDNWECGVVMEKCFEGDGSAITVVKHSGKWPPEDCGGPGGYIGMLRALEEGKGEEYENIVNWLSDMKYEDFDIETANKKLSKLFSKFIKS